MPEKPANTDRERRLAEALRRNLRRRKAPRPHPPGDGPDAPPDPS